MGLTEFRQHHRRQGATRGDLPLQKAEPSAVRGKPCLNYSLDRAILRTVAEAIAPAESGEVHCWAGFSKSAQAQQRTSDPNSADRNLFSVGSIAWELKILFRFGVSFFFASSAINSLLLHPDTGVRTKHPSHQ